jgi:hypothetical protein
MLLFMTHYTRFHAAEGLGDPVIPFILLPVFTLEKIGAGLWKKWKGR